MKKLYLKPSYALLKSQYEEMMQHRGCSCHINPPCTMCTHEGNPLNLENTPDAWAVPIHTIEYDVVSKVIAYNPDTGELRNIITGTVYKKNKEPQVCASIRKRYGVQGT